MSATFTLRRLAAALSQTALKTPVRQTLPHATPVLQRRCLSAATRALGSQTRSCTTAGHLACSKKQFLSSTIASRSQVRLYSNDSGPSLRQWGFEDINTSLPTTTPTTPSPTHKPLILIDVREPAELTSTGIIPSALSIPLASQPDALYLTPDEFETRFGFPKPAVDAESNLVFYCKAGVRARAAAQLAVQAGYDPEKVGVYEGSWLDWEKRGGKVVRWEGEHS